LKFIKECYVTPVDDDTLVEKSIAGALSALDPHSGYLNKKALEALQMHADGKYGGLGIEVMIDGGLLRIIAPIDGTPAFRAGLKSGDLITHVNDVFFQGTSLEEIVGKLRGAPGSSVRLTIKRAGQNPFKVDLKREIILVHPVSWELHDGIAFIRISTFGRGATKELEGALEKLPKGSTKGLVLDLRDNPGGLLEEAVSVADLFLDGGDIVSTRGRDSSMNKVFHATKGEKLPRVPLVVLVNNGSASASEIVAGALQHYHRAVIVGTQTFGKGSVQKVVPISEKAGVKLTVACYYLPSGQNIQRHGVTPDVVVPLATVKIAKDLFFFREKDIPHAMQAAEKAAEKIPEKSKEEQRALIEKVSQKERGDRKGKEEDGEEDMRKLPLSERLEKDLQLMQAFSIVRALGCKPAPGK
jgi:carboxyl-terminal processing protease